MPPRAISSSRSYSPNDPSGELSAVDGAGWRLPGVVGASGWWTWLPALVMSSAPSRAHCAHKPLGQYAGKGVPHSAQLLVSGIRFLFSRQAVTIQPERGIYAASPFDFPNAAEGSRPR